MYNIRQGWRREMQQKARAASISQRHNRLRFTGLVDALHSLILFLIARAICSICRWQVAMPGIISRAAIRRLFYLSISLTYASHQIEPRRRVYSRGDARAAPTLHQAECCRQYFEYTEGAPSLGRSADELRCGRGNKHAWRRPPPPYSLHCPRLTRLYYNWSFIYALFTMTDAMIGIYALLACYICLRLFHMPLIGRSAQVTPRYLLLFLSWRCDRPSFYLMPAPASQTRLHFDACCQITAQAYAPAQASLGSMRTGHTETSRISCLLSIYYFHSYLQSI